MIVATIWRDLRWRLLAASLLVVPPAGLVAWSYLLQARRISANGVAASSGPYLEYLDAAWFLLPGPSAAFLPAAVLIGTGGALLRSRTDLAFLLGGLPVSRDRWLLTHLLVSQTALGALVLVVLAVLAACAWRAGVPLPLGAILLRSAAVFGAASAWVGVAVGVLAATRSSILAATLVMGAAVVLPASRFRLDLPVRAQQPPMLPSWDPWTLADPRAWQSAMPTPSLLVAAALGLAGVLFAYQRVKRFEP